MDCIICFPNTLVRLSTFYVVVTNCIKISISLILGKQFRASFSFIKTNIKTRMNEIISFQNKRVHWDCIFIYVRHWALSRAPEDQESLVRKLMSTLKLGCDKFRPSISPSLPWPFSREKVCTSAYLQNITLYQIQSHIKRYILLSVLLQFCSIAVITSSYSF